jgi:hypothetical protein
MLLCSALTPSPSSAGEGWGEGEWLRRCTSNPALLINAATSSKRCGWRGTIASFTFARSSTGIAFHACSSKASSPSRVLAASSTGLPSAARHSRPSASSAPSKGASNFTLPITGVFRAPHCVNRCASAAVCASTASNAANAGRVSAGQRA